MVDKITESLALLTHKDHIITIQKHFRAFRIRTSRMPVVMYKIKECLIKDPLPICSIKKDGRKNSCNDEDTIIDILVKKFGDRIIVPPEKSRMWYDILVYDYKYHWIPVNIKSTTMKTADNTGNLTMCVYSYTDEILDLHKKPTYKNGEMSRILFNKLKNREYNNSSKDYYFLVINKTNSSDVIINSILGLTSLTPNSNNLPFQVKWSANRIYNYRPIREKIDTFIKCILKPQRSWKEDFLSNMRTLELEN